MQGAATQQCPSPCKEPQRRSRAFWQQPFGTREDGPHGGVARRLFGITKLHSSRLALRAIFPRRNREFIMDKLQ
jgi:hypothetical protein